VPPSVLAYRGISTTALPPLCANARSAAYGGAIHVGVNFARDSAASHYDQQLAERLCPGLGQMAGGTLSWKSTHTGARMGHWVTTLEFSSCRRANASCKSWEYGSAAVYSASKIRLYAHGRDERLWGRAIGRKRRVCSHRRRVPNPATRSGPHPRTRSNRQRKKCGSKIRRCDKDTRHMDVNGMPTGCQQLWGVSSRFRRAKPARTYDGSPPKWTGCSNTTAPRLFSTIVSKQAISKRLAARKRSSSGPHHRLERRWLATSIFSTCPIETSTPNHGRAVFADGLESSSDPWDDLKAGLGSFHVRGRCCRKVVPAGHRGLRVGTLLDGGVRSSTASISTAINSSAVGTHAQTNRRSGLRRLGPPNGELSAMRTAKRFTEAIS